VGYVAIVSFGAFILSMILFITAEVFSVMKLKRKECTAVRAFLWFEVLGFLSVKKYHYELYDRGSDRLVDCEKKWWQVLISHADNMKLAAEEAWRAIKEMRSESSVKRYIFISTLEKITRTLGVLLYVIFFTSLVMISDIPSWVWGSLLIPLWNVYKLYYVYGVFAPIVRMGLHREE